MAKLPSEADLGVLPSANSGRPIASVDTGAIGKGVEALGTGIEHVGQGLNAIVKQQDQYEYANAHADLLKAAVDLNTKYLSDTDYATRPQRYQADFQQFVSQRAESIKNPNIRERFLSNAGEIGAQENYKQTFYSTQLGNSDAIAKLDTEGENYIGTTIGNPDEQTRASALLSYSSRVDALVAAKTLSPVQGMLKKRKFAHDYNLARANFLIDNANIGDGSLDKLKGEISSAGPDFSNIDSLQGDERQKAAYKFFLSKGWSPVAAAGIVGGLNGETGNLTPDQVHDGGIGLGIAGWNKERLAALNDFAKRNGASPTSLQTQLEFVDHELRGNENAAGTRIASATDPRQAGDASLAYFRPANWNVPGAHPERAANAANVFAKYGNEHAEPAQSATAGPPSTFSFLSTLERQQLQQKIDRAKNAQLIDMERQERLDRVARLQQSDSRENEILKDAYSDNPTVTAQQIVADTLPNGQPNPLTREARERLTKFVENPPGLEPAAGVSHRNATYLLDRIRKPEGDINRINDVSPIYDAYLQNKITKADFKFVRDEFLTIRTPDGQNFEKEKGDLLAIVKAQLDKSTLIKESDSGKQAYYLFQFDLNKKIAEYRSAGKDPRALLDPDKPDFIGSQANMRRYVLSISDQTNREAQKLRALPGTGTRYNEIYGPASAPAVVPRKPGETLQDWRIRTGAETVQEFQKRTGTLPQPPGPETIEDFKTRTTGPQ